ncbi:general substrate transporter [Phlyctochytrium arcticum]|nr:general substrate transporter [Phlyctochytrium arcticum]
MGYVFFYAIGLGCVPWIIISGIFPLEIHGKGAGIAIAANWTTNLLLSVTFLTLTEAISPAGTLLIFGGAVIVGWIFVYTTVPETKGVGLEGVGQGADFAEIIFAAH